MKRISVVVFFLIYFLSINFVCVPARSYAEDSPVLIYGTRENPDRIVTDTPTSDQEISSNSVGQEEKEFPDGVVVRDAERWMFCPAQPMPTSSSITTFVYPQDITSVEETFYIEELGNTIVKFRPVLFSKYISTVYAEAFKRIGGLKGGENVLDLGTGTGILGFLALASGAQKVVATDIDRLAILNAEFNAQHLGFQDRFEVRLVPHSDPTAYSVIGKDERFDLIVAELPSAYGAFIFSAIDGLADHLTENGRAIMAIGRTSAKVLLLDLVQRNNLSVRILYDASKDFILTGPQTEALKSQMQYEKEVQGNCRVTLEQLKHITVFELKRNKVAVKNHE